MDSEIIELINKRIDDANSNSNRRFDALEEKVDSILKFKWQIFGGVAAITFIITVAFQMLSLNSK